MRKFLFGFAVALVGIVPLAQAQSNPYPNKPIRLIVGYAAGGISDIIARTVANGMSKHLGQPVVVDNKPGASGMIGAELLAKSPADGYTLGLTSGGPITINIQMVEKPRYDPIKDFTHVGLVTVNDQVLVVNNKFPAKNFTEFVDEVKRNPGKYSFASAGLGLPTHLGGELLKQTVGLDLVHVPYKGDSPALVDVIAGNVPMMVAAFGSAANHIKAGQVRAIAMFSKARLPSVSDVPTVAEMGYPGFNAMTWGGISGPAGLPPEVVTRLSTALKATMNDPEVKAKYAEIGSNVAYTTPDELTAFIKDDAAKWGAIIKKLGLKISQ